MGWVTMVDCEQAVRAVVARPPMLLSDQPPLYQAVHNGPGSCTNVPLGEPRLPVVRYLETVPPSQGIRIALRTSGGRFHYDASRVQDG